MRRVEVKRQKGHARLRDAGSSSYARFVGVIDIRAIPAGARGGGRSSLFDRTSATAISPRLRPFHLAALRLCARPSLAPGQALLIVLGDEALGLSGPTIAARPSSRERTAQRRSDRGDGGAESWKMVFPRRRVERGPFKIPINGADLSLSVQG